MIAECCGKTYDLHGCARCQDHKRDARNDVCPKCGKLLFPKLADPLFRKEIRGDYAHREYNFERQYELCNRLTVKQAIMLTGLFLAGLMFLYWISR